MLTVTNKKLLPHLQEYNLFSDGSVKHDKKLVIIAGYLTQKDKVWITYRKKINYEQCCDSNYAELLAIYYGLKIAQESGVVNLKMFTDSSVSVEKILAKINHKKINEKYDVLVNEIMEILPKEFSFKHITREKNSYADFLTHENLL